MERKKDEDRLVSESKAGRLLQAVRQTFLAQTALSPKREELTIAYSTDGY